MNHPKILSKRRVVVAAILLTLGLVGPAVGAEQRRLKTVAEFDLNRYLGRWHQVALIPNRFQAQCVGDTTAYYALASAGRIQVTNRCRTASGNYDQVTGEARMQKSWKNPAILEVRFAPKWLGFLPFVWADYWVMAVEPDYSAALVGSPDRKFLWILARQAKLDDKVFERFVDLASREGFEARSIQRTP